MTKRVAFKPQPASADQWISGTGQHKPAEPMKRFTIDVPLELHRRIKTQCAAKGIKMADLLRQIFEREFPKP